MECRSQDRPSHSDPGFAVYFTYRGKAMCFASDRWDEVEPNIHAVAKTIEALRGISRWGAGDMMDRAFSGFAALPAPATHDWRQVPQLEERTVTRDGIETAYRRRAKSCHSDAGGSDDLMAELNQARVDALREIETYRLGGMARPLTA